MRKYLVCALIFAIGLTLPGIGFSQEESAEEVEYSYGTVSNIDNAKKEIVVSEYDYDNDQDIPVTYSVDPNAEFEGIASFKEIEPGHYVDIEYVVGKNNKKTAKIITVYKSESDFE